MKTENVNRESDRFLLEQMERGSKKAFDELYSRYWEWAYMKALVRLGDTDQTKDVVQNIFLRIWVRRENPIENFQSYLHVAIRNQVFKVMAKEKRNYPLFDSIQNIGETNCQPDRDMLWNEFYREYQALIGQLPPKRQRIFRLRFHGGLTTKKISTELGVSRKTVQNQLGKAISQLRLSFSGVYT